MFDVIVIGGGVVGGLILRELTKYQLTVGLVEKENDVCMGASKANSGIVHAGYDAKPNTLKARFNVSGNRLMPALCRELGVVAFNEEEVEVLKQLKTRGETNGVKGLEIINAARLRGMEPNISPLAKAALYAPTAGTVCPYGLTIAAIGNAMDNGAKLYTGFDVDAIQKKDEFLVVTGKDGRQVRGKVVVNCAGGNSGEIARLVGDDWIQIGQRKGEYILLDRESANFLSHTLFFTPTQTSKGILVTKTVDGNVLMGPTAEEIERYDTSTSATGLDYVMQKAGQMCQNPPFYNTITAFSGVRAFSSRHDFIIEESKTTKGVVHCAGIESPGLTAAPALAEYVVNEIIAGLLTLQKNSRFDGKRAPDYFFKDLSKDEQNAMIEKDPSYGKIVCRCEQITEGEILRAIRENPPASDIDGVKRRTRAGMGRCQGGFCQPYVAELIAKEHGIPLEKVTKSGGASNLLVGVTK